MLCLCPESGTDYTKQKRMGCLLTQTSRTAHPINWIPSTLSGASFFFFLWFDWRLATDSRVHYRHLSRCPRHSNVNRSDSTAPPAGPNMNDLFQFIRSSPISVDQWQLEVWLWEESCGEFALTSHTRLCWCVWSHHGTHLPTTTDNWQKSHKATKSVVWKVRCQQCDEKRVTGLNHIRALFFKIVWQQNLLFCYT